MTERRPFWAATVMIALAALALTACAGNLPLSDSLGVIDAEASELEFTAPVDGMGPDSWSIGGLAVEVSAATEIAGEPQVGDLVRVQATLGQSGLTAHSIESVAPAEPSDTLETPQPTEDEVEFTGPVVSMGADSWTVGDTTFAVTIDTEIHDAILVGDVVKVHASVNPDQSLTAREIELAEADDPEVDEQEEDEQDLEFKGVVESISADTWILAGMSFMVTPETEIKDSIVVGDFVEIHAFLSVDGVLTALRIELAGDDDGRSGEELNDDEDDGQDDDGQSGEELNDDDDDDSGDQEHEDESDDDSDDDSEDGGSSGSGGSGSD